MKESDALAARLDELEEAYREAAVQHGAAIASGRHRVANRNYDVLERIATELRARGVSGQELLLRLLQSPDVSTRLWAATHSVAFAPSEAEATLRVIAEGVASPQRLVAEMTLSEWHKNRT